MSVQLFKKVAKQSRDVDDILRKKALEAFDSRWSDRSAREENLPIARELAIFDPKIQTLL